LTIAEFFLEDSGEIQVGLRRATLEGLERGERDSVDMALDMSALLRWSELRKVEAVDAKGTIPLFGATLEVINGLDAEFTVRLYRPGSMDTSEDARVEDGGVSRPVFSRFRHFALKKQRSEPSAQPTTTGQATQIA